MVAEGISASDFWDMSWHEIGLVVKATKARRRRDMADQAAIAWKQADLFCHGAAIAFNGTKKAGKFQSFAEAFPNFAQLMESDNDAEDAKDWRRYRDQMNAVAAHHNKALSGGR